MLRSYSLKVIARTIARWLVLIVMQVAIAVSLTSCQMPINIPAEASVPSRSSELLVLQKQLTGEHSDAKIIALLQQLIAQQQTLLTREQVDAGGWPLPNIAVVILYETELCQLDKQVRSARLNRFKNDKTLMARFETLLLASCAPDFTPSVLARSVKQVRQAREWPHSYLAYFDLLERHQQALLRLEKLYGNLKLRMDTTLSLIHI